MGHFLGFGGWGTDWNAGTIPLQRYSGHVKLPLTSGLLEPRHTGIPSHLALKICCKADKAWIGKSNRAYSDELFPRVHVRGRLMEGDAVLERLRLPGPEQPPDLQKQKVKDTLGCLSFQVRWLINNCFVPHLLRQKLRWDVGERCSAVTQDPFL